MLWRAALSVVLCLLGAEVFAQPVASGGPHRTRLRGRVVTSTGEPLVGASILVMPDAEQWRHELAFTVENLLAAPSGTSGVQGRFEAVAPPGAVLLVAAPGHLAVMVRGRDPSGSIPAGLVVALPRATVHVGTVRDAAGAPVAGALVRGTPLVGAHWYLGGATLTAWAATRSDARGRFKLRCAPPNALRVDVFAAGHYRASVAPVGEGTPLNLVLEPSGFVSGRAVDRDGVPLVGMLLDVGYEATLPGLFGSCVTDAEGRFRATVVARGRLRLTALDLDNGRRFASPILEGPADGVLVRPVAAEAADGRAARFELRLREAESGAPVAGARVAVVDGLGRARSDPTLVPHASGPWGDGEFPTTGNDGRIELDLPASEHRRRNAQMQVRAAGRAALIRYVDLESASFPLEIELREEAVVRGRVVDPEGRPIVAAEVFWVQTGAGAGFLWLGGPQVHAVRTDGDGHYELRGLPRTRVALLAATPAHLGPSPQVVEAAGDEREFVVDFTLEPARRVAVQLPDGVRPAGYSVSWTVPETILRRLGDTRILHMPSTVRQAAFGVDGRVAFDVTSPGAIHFVLHRMARASSPYELRFPLPAFEDRGGGEVAIPLAALATARVSGKVVTDGVPFTRFAVELVAVDAEPVEIASTGLHGIRCPIDATGSFDLEVRPGRYGLMLFDLETGLAVHESEEALELAAGSDLALRVEPHLVRIGMRLTPPPADDGPPALGRLLLCRPEARYEARRTGYYPFLDWSPQRRFELLAPPGPLGVQLRAGIESLVVSGPRNADPLVEAEFLVRDAAAQEFELLLPVRLPTADIDR